MQIELSENFLEMFDMSLPYYECSRKDDIVYVDGTEANIGIATIFSLMYLHGLTMGDIIQNLKEMDDFNRDAEYEAEQKAKGNG